MKYNNDYYKLIHIHFIKNNKTIIFICTLDLDSQRIMFLEFYFKLKLKLLFLSKLLEIVLVSVYFKNLGRWSIFQN